MKRSITEFECDECGEVSVREEGKEFPYENGWRYIFELKYKNSIKTEKPMKDKHFCSKKCITKWFSKLIEPKIKR